MTSVGETLRHERVKQGLGLDEVAARTKIQARYLVAIESDQRENLPGSFFYRSFVHQYAGMLGLDNQEIGAKLDAVLGEETPPLLPGQQMALVHVSRVNFNDTPSFRPQPWLWSVGLLVVVVLGCSGFYVWWNHNSSAEAHSAPASVAATQATTPAVETAPAAAPASTPEPATGVSQTSPNTPTPSAPPANESVASAAPGNSTAPIRLNVTANEATWVSISSDGKRIFSGVLQANESKAIEGNESAKMTIGNAGGLTIEMNGTSIGSLGAHGQVRIIQFTPGKFEFVQPQTPTQPAATGDVSNPSNPSRL